MRLGIPLWRDEVSPVCDVAAKRLVVDIEDAASRGVSFRWGQRTVPDGQTVSRRWASTSALIHEGFLRRTRDGSFVRADMA